MIRSEEGQKRTPSEVSEFEREQLRFLLSDNDMGATLATINPSLAWLPFLWQMQLVKDERQLIAWIERNFADVQAIRDVVANLHFFGPDTAVFLEHRLNSRADALKPLLLKSWRLIIRSMKATKKGPLEDEWFEIEPQVKRGDHSAALLERLAEALRPKLNLRKPYSLREEAHKRAVHLFDLMMIEYEVADSLSGEEVLEAWPADAAAETDARLLAQLSTTLRTTIEDAIEVGVEGERFSQSDNDVPSIAHHKQNDNHSGFYPIIRVSANLWLRLAEKSQPIALSIVQQWSKADCRLLRRLALFASKYAIVPANLGSDILLEMPLGELFLTGASVEVYELIRSRWNEFERKRQEAIVSRLCKGPPRRWFRQDADIDGAVDRARFDLLHDMKRNGVDIGEAADLLLVEISARRPKWKPRPADKAGFHVWHGSDADSSASTADKLENVADDQLVPEAKRIVAAREFWENDNWRDLCATDPDRALRGLVKAAESGDWTPQLWQQFLLTRKSYADSVAEQQVARLLLQWPTGTFEGVADPVSSWLYEHALTLDDAPLWQLWDRIADYSLTEKSEVDDD